MRGEGGADHFLGANDAGAQASSGGLCIVASWLLHPSHSVAQITPIRRTGSNQSWRKPKISARSSLYPRHCEILSFCSSRELATEINTTTRVDQATFSPLDALFPKARVKIIVDETVTVPFELVKVMPIPLSKTANTPSKSCKLSWHWYLETTQTTRTFYEKYRWSACCI